MGDSEGRNGADGALAAQRAHRSGDYSAILARVRAGHRLIPAEKELLERFERGAKIKPGPKDPRTAYEAVVCWRWLVEQAGWSGPDACSLLGEMMGVTPDVIKSRISRAKGLGKNIADLCFDLHAQRGVTPALLRHRDAKGHCLGCVDRAGRAIRVQCRCDPAPRPELAETPEGATVAVLLSFWRAGG